MRGGKLRRTLRPYVAGAHASDIVFDGKRVRQVSSAAATDEFLSSGSGLVGTDL